jgi:hypothetical protein
MFAARTSLLRLRQGQASAPVWWVWVYTSWITNWQDPVQRPVRLLLTVPLLALLTTSTLILVAAGGSILHPRQATRI